MIPSRFFSLRLPPLLALLVAPSLWAADAVAPVVSGVRPWNMVLGLLFLLIIVAGGWWLTRRMAGVQFSGGNRSLRVIATTMVGPRERVVLLEVGGGEQLLLGVAPGQVTLLKQLDQPLPSDPRGGDDFAARLRHLLQQGAGR